MIRRDINSTRKTLCWKKTINIWDVNTNNIVIPKLIKTKTNSMYLIGYLDKVIKPLALILPKMSKYVKTFKVKDRDKDKKINYCFSVKMMKKN